MTDIAALGDSALARLSNALEDLVYSPDQRPVPQITEAMEDVRAILRAVGAPAACHCPEHGSWLAAGDIQRMTRELDVAMNGPEGAAKQASLCDLIPSLRERIRQSALERAVQRAAGELPELWSITIEVEAGAGGVCLMDPFGAKAEFDEADRTLAEQVIEALNTAKETKA